MDERPPTATEALMIEIVRYLAAVDVFRAEQCEPTWRAQFAHGDPAVRRIGRTAEPLPRPARARRRPHRG